jgi:hypothetical protein
MDIKAGVAGYSTGCFCLSLGFDGSYFLSRGCRAGYEVPGELLIRVLPVKLLIRHWSLLLALRLFLVMVAAWFEVFRQ